MEFYLNSERIHKEEMSIFFDNSEWETEFLTNNIRFIGKGSPYNITGLSVWSGALTEEDIANLFTCKKEHSDADIMRWDDVEFDISPPTDNIQVLEIKDDEPCKWQAEFFFISELEFVMDNKKEASRKCFALGGTMDAFGDENELQELNQDCYLWAPAFRSGDGWVDNNNNEVKYLPWAENEPTYPDKFRCIGIEDNEYIAEPCSAQFCFYCKMRSYGIFRLRGSCKSFIHDTKKIHIDDLFVFFPKRVVNGKPIWLGTTNTIIKWNEMKT